MKKPIIRSTLRQAVREAVIERVHTGELAAGSRVNETTLARELGVSPTPVREALMSLEACRYLSATPGKGFVVARYDAQEVHDIYSVLATMDTTALRAAWPFSADKIAHLRELNEAFRQLQGDVNAAIQADVRWHAELVSACHNKYLLELIASGRQTVQRYEYAFLQQVMNTQSSAKQHEAVIAALEREELDEAVAQLTINWQRNIELLRPFLLESESDTDGR